MVAKLNLVLNTFTTTCESWDPPTLNGENDPQPLEGLAADVLAYQSDCLISPVVEYQEYLQMLKHTVCCRKWYVQFF